MGKVTRTYYKTPHTVGSKSFARVRHDYEMTQKKRPGRVEFFYVTHTRKYGNFINREAQELAEKTISLVEEHAATVENHSAYDIEEVVFASVFKEDKYGRVRGYGLGVTPTQLSGAQQPKRRASQFEVDRLQHQMENMHSLYEAKIESIKEGYERKSTAMKMDYDEKLNNVTKAYEERLNDVTNEHERKLNNVTRDMDEFRTSMELFQKLFSQDEAWQGWLGCSHIFALYRYAAKMVDPAARYMSINAARWPSNAMTKYSQSELCDDYTYTDTNQDHGYLLGTDTEPTRYENTTWLLRPLSPPCAPPPSALSIMCASSVRPLHRVRLLCLRFTPCVPPLVRPLHRVRLFRPHFPPFESQLTIALSIASNYRIFSLINFSFLSLSLNSPNCPHPHETMIYICVPEDSDDNEEDQVSDSSSESEFETNNNE
ncbi:hypothetical protein Scep_023943 [Stephania cephalantha]|uniref:Uncharacterized protein n=1 Tax=Stephania cephalantha TaxID=152367 RepID=A0AAP0HT88_9MAGN